jgi:hypothetical protein
MSDIVERLNRGEGCLEEGGQTCISMNAVSGCLCAIAADEITRLTAENERLRAALDLYRDAVVIDVTMEGPRFMGSNSSALKRAWDADCAELSGDKQ